MKIKLLLFFLVLSTSSINVYADGVFGHPTFETVDQARARHSAENYNTYKNNNYQAPLGGYSSKLGDPSPAGTLQPGYVNNGLNTNYNNQHNNNSLNGW